ncbi:MAG: FHA domain-containing protein [Methylophilaceae bacterium]
MAKLIFILDGNLIKEYALDKERITIGRRAANDIHIDNLAISGEHAVIVTTGEDAYLEDLNSTNGTLLNKKKIKKQLLNHGDEIGLGKYELKYLKDAVVNKVPSDGFADTVLDEPKSTMTKDNAVPEGVQPLVSKDVEGSEALSNQAELQEEGALVTEEVHEHAETVISDEVALAEPLIAPRLQIINGENAGSALLLDKAIVKVGESNKQVAVVSKRPKGFFLTHVAGDKRPLVNGKQIGVQAYALSNHDEIEVLGVKMEFYLD